MNMPVSASTQRLELARASLLTPNDVDAHHLEDTLFAFSGNGVDYADLYFESSVHEDWRLEHGKVTRGGYSRSQGVGGRTISGDKSAFAYSSDMTPRGLKAVVQATQSMRRHGQDAGQNGGVDMTSNRSVEVADTPALYPALTSPGTLEPVEILALLRRIDESARADPRITQVTAQLSVQHSIVFVAASDGTQAGDIRPLVRLYISVLAESNGRRANGAAGTGGRYLLSALPQADLDIMIQRATSTALVKLDARPAPAGEMTVVLGAGFPGVMLHEAVGHGLEGDANRKRSSVFADLMGARIGAPGITVVDDATIPNAVGALNMDDEGTPGERTVLIEDGILVGLMQDRTNARLMNSRSTGNGRRQSYAHLPMPRMTNTFLEAGPYAPDEIIASVKSGIYAEEFGGGTVDPTSGQFNFSAVKAYLIEDGRLTAPIEGATLIGLGHEALKQISMVGQNLKLDEGEAYCGKNGQTLPVCVGQPTVRIDRMIVGGAR